MNTYTTAIAAITLCFASQAVTANEKVELQSPDGQITVNVYVDGSGQPVYDASYRGQPVLRPSLLGLLFRSEPGFDCCFTIAEVVGWSKIPQTNQVVVIACCCAC